MSAPRLILTAGHTLVHYAGISRGRGSLSVVRSKSLKMNNTNRTILAVIVLAVVVGAGWYVLSKPTTAGGKTVAIVNGTAITQSQLQSEETQIGAQMGATGTSTALFQDAALNALIGTTLLKQAAAKAGYTASSTAVATQLAAVKSQFKTVQDYQNALKAQNLTETQLRVQIADNLVIGQFLQHQLNLSAATATEAEIQAAYTSEVAQQPTSTNTPKLAAVHDQIAQMIVQQKQQQAVAQYINQLRAGAQVKILISTSTPAVAPTGAAPTSGTGSTTGA